MKETHSKLFINQTEEIIMMKIYLVILLIIGGILFTTGCKKEPEPQKPEIDLKVEGGNVELLKGEEAGLPLETVPGVKTITFAEWLKMDEIPETGLYLVDTDFIPHGLPEALKEEGITLNQDGSLDSAGVKFALFIQSQVYRIVDNQSSLENQPGFLEKLAGLFAGEAVAAEPYPFSRYSWNLWWRYRGGFCRDYKAKTIAEAWGPLQGGFRPHTRIEYIETRVEMGSRRDRDSCSGCDEQSSFTKWDIGCFWPAHGGASGWHYANWKDGGFSATITWSWSH
jgi:hypothetical protein